MDLIYADKNGLEIGFLPPCELDMAFGKDENSFECTIDMDNHCCEFGYIVYAVGTEYGGIVDAIAPDTNKRTVTYSGRTWHGVLEGKVICPDAGQNYYSVSGEANIVLAAIINKLGLSNIFEVSTADSGIDIGYYRFERYVSAYTGIRKMLYDSRAKLKITSETKKVRLSVESLIDYSQNDEFDGSLLRMSVKKTYRPVNHLVCLGTGDLGARKVIHLFTDENGGVQPYANALIPYSDSDYITDTSMQQLFGQDEVSEILDYPNAPVVYNYLYLSKKPSDWGKNIQSYYSLTENGQFEELKSWQEDAFSVLWAKPYDWDVAYGSYYYPQDGTYHNVTSVSEDIFTILAAQPSDWNTNYGSYYMVKDGEYYTVSAVSEELYVVQANQPENWSTNYENYYQYLDGKFQRVSPVIVGTYTKLSEKPGNWETEYGNYYFKTNDGVIAKYERMRGIAKYRYDLQTQKPSDWDWNYGSYFYLKQHYKYYYKEKTVDGEYVIETQVTYDEAMPTGKINSTLTRTFVKKVLQFKDYAAVPSERKWKAKKYYTKISYDIAPPWKANAYFAYSESEIAPTWQAGTYYTQTIKTVPTWQAGTYYSKSINTIPKWGAGMYYSKAVVTKYPQFFSNTYFEKKEDNYAALVEKGIERLRSLSNADKLNVDFAPDEVYDIGDIVGATEQVTGISVAQPITKKIVTIKEEQEIVEYEIGE